MICFTEFYTTYQDPFFFSQRFDSLFLTAALKRTSWRTDNMETFQREVLMLASLLLALVDFLLHKG
jgi:putative SOS response-associated peptidase YedK